MVNTSSNSTNLSSKRVRDTLREELSGWKMNEPVDSMKS